MCFSRPEIRFFVTTAEPAKNCVILGEWPLLNQRRRGVRGTFLRCRKFNMDKPFGPVRSARVGKLTRGDIVMRVIAFFAAAAALVGSGFGSISPASGAAQKDEKRVDKTAAKSADKPTAAAELTRTTSLKAKMSVAFTDARLGDVLKEFAAQVDMKADTLLLWTYGPNFPYAQKVTYSCKDKPLEVALDELFTKLGTLGYIVVSKDGDKHDGWILLTTTGERGAEKVLPKATAEEEADATDKLGLAKKLIDVGKNEQAKTVLTYILKKYPTAKAATEAKELLGKLEK
jgi:hypothetical protein